MTLPRIAVRKTLRLALAGHPGDKFTAASVRLETLAYQARRAAPFAFFADVLGAGGGRHRFLARLGAEANDALDEFLNLALDYERYETPSLQGFLAWLRKARAEIKRDMEIARDEVRVMTVHGAKGLEAPIVILADTVTPPAGPRPPRLLTLAGGPLIWVGRKADDVAPVQAARQLFLRDAEDEYRRLLYVAMTRAADRLIVCGAEGVRRPPDCWYDLVHTPLAELLVEEQDGGETVWRYRKSTGKATPPPSSQKSEAKPERPALPAWLREAVPAEVPSAVYVSPSSAYDEEFAHATRMGGSAVDRVKALQRGRVVHRLMQSLPDIPRERRRDAAMHYLGSAATDFTAAEQSAIVKQILGILDDPNFASVFAPGSHAEVPIVGRIFRPPAIPVAVAGQVDRLTMTDSAILIADFKTDRNAPLELGKVPKPYTAQIALYRAVLAKIYPGKTVRAALVFTEAPRLIEIPAAALEAALAEILKA